MSTERVSINDFLNLSTHQLILDVRSPSEYRHACLPRAVSIPLFDDEERKVVGTIYKQQSRQEAIKTGLDFFGPKMKRIVEEVEGLVSSKQLTVDPDSAAVDGKQPTDNLVLIYCWRGGMRSAAIAWLLGLYGFNVKVLSGGYKSFRNWVLDKLSYAYCFKIIGGFTGSGKTEILKELEKSNELVINLEELAHHKGSAFGSIGMPAQPSQEMFENLLALELFNNYETGKRRTGSKLIAEGLTPHPQETIWLEDESQRIGRLNLPNPLWENMRRSPLYFLDIPFEERLQHIIEEYGNCNKEEMTESIRRISKRLGPLETKNAIKALEQDNAEDCFRTLLTYYDKHYLKSLHGRQNLSQLLTRISGSKVHPSNAGLLLSQQPVA